MSSAVYRFNDVDGGGGCVSVCRGEVASIVHGKPVLDGMLSKNKKQQ